MTWQCAAVDSHLGSWDEPLCALAGPHVHPPPTGQLQVSDGRLSPSGICFEARFKKPGCGRDYAAIVVADVCDPAGLVAPRGPNAKPSKDPREVLLHQMPRQVREGAQCACACACHRRAIHTSRHAGN